MTTVTQLPLKLTVIFWLPFLPNIGNTHPSRQDPQCVSSEMVQGVYYRQGARSLQQMYPV